MDGHAELYEIQKHGEILVRNIVSDWLHDDFYDLYDGIDISESDWTLIVDIAADLGGDIAPRSGVKEAKEFFRIRNKDASKEVE